MRRIKYNSITALLFLFTAVFSFTMEPQLKKEADAVIGMLINCEFSRAMNSTDSLRAIDSTEPLYPFLHLCALGLRDLDFDRIVDTVAFLQYYKLTISTIEGYEALHGRDSYSMTLLGFTYATHSSFYLMHKKYFSAIGTGLDAVKIFNDIKEIDSTNYDAQFFLGFYNYAKGELKKRLWMVLFWFPGSKKDGIRTLEACTNHNQLTAEVAKMSLVDVYIQEEEYEKSRKLYTRLRKKYPRSRFLFWSNARYYEAVKDYKKAADAYDKLAMSYESNELGEYNALVTRLKQIEFLDKAGLTDTAADVAEKVLKKEYVCNKEEHYRKICRDIRRYCRD